MLGLISIIFSTISLVLSIYALIEIKAMQRSTHKVTFYDPKTQKFEAAKATDQKMDDIYDNIM